jgi:hypothetical protein
MLSEHAPSSSLSGRAPATSSGSRSSLVLLRRRNAARPSARYRFPPRCRVAALMLAALPPEGEDWLCEIGSRTHGLQGRCGAQRRREAACRAPAIIGAEGAEKSAAWARIDTVQKVAARRRDHRSQGRRASRDHQKARVVP